MDNAKERHVDNVVITKDDNALHSCWQFTCIVAANQGTGGCVHIVKLALVSACLEEKGRRVSKVKFLKHPVQKLVLLLLKNGYETESQGESQPIALSVTGPQSH